MSIFFVQKIASLPSRELENGLISDRSSRFVHELVFVVVVFHGNKGFCHCHGIIYSKKSAFGAEHRWEEKPKSAGM